MVAALALVAVMSRSALIGEWLSCLSVCVACRLQPRRKRRLPRDSLSGGTPSTQRVATGTPISNVTVLSLEMFAMSRGTLLPDPRLDAVRAVCYAVEAQEGPQDAKTTERGVVLWLDDALDASSSDNNSVDAAQAAQFCLASSSNSGVAVRIATSERELLEHVIRVVNDWDPDFVTGFEVQKASIGYLIDRANQLNVGSPHAVARCRQSYWSLISHTRVCLLSLVCHRSISSKRSRAFHTQPSTRATRWRDRAPMLRPSVTVTITTTMARTKASQSGRCGA